jgi:hypothetical protein
MADDDISDEEFEDESIDEDFSDEPEELDEDLVEEAESDDEFEEDEDEEEQAEPDDRGDGTGRIQPKKADEFVCQSCFLVKHRRQLADEDLMLCVDCV